MKLANCAEALRRHHFEVETVKDITEAFAVLKAIAERERPEIVSFGDSETMHATGIVGWLRGDGRWKLLDGFDPAMSYPERLEIRRQALMSDLFITGVNAISMEGSSGPASWSSWPDATRSSPTVPRPRSASARSPHRKTSHGTRGSARRAPERAYARTVTRPIACATRVWRCCGAGPQGACWSC